MDEEVKREKELSEWEVGRAEKRVRDEEKTRRNRARRERGRKGKGGGEGKEKGEKEKEKAREGLVEGLDVGKEYAGVKGKDGKGDEDTKEEAGVAVIEEVGVVIHDDND